MIVIIKCLPFISCFFAISVIDCKPDKFFRNGYTYLEATKSFYKIHTIFKTWKDAKTLCEIEGATLFYPQDAEEAKAVIAYWTSTQMFTWIHIGISSPNIQGVFETVDGLSMDIVYNNWAPWEPTGDIGGCVVMKNDAFLYDDVCEPRRRPFVCKKTEASLRWNDLCNIPDREYIYNEKTGRCYKFHLTPKTWNGSYATCDGEQSRLAVINSDIEAKIFVDIINKSPKDLIDGEYVKNTAHLGFKYDDGWKTYQGIDLRNSGYVKWGKGLPEGRGKRTCGAMFFDGLLNAVTCDSRSFFMCEHEVSLLQTDLAYKFGEENVVQHG